MTTFFISDLHLQASAPKITKIFLQFLSHEAKNAEALYILGDLFEAWIGDDDNSAFVKNIKAALKSYTDTGIPTYFMRGNRDFVIGERFAKETGITLLEDPYVLNLYGKDILLMHGDLLCIDDTAYQNFRKKAYDPAFQRRMLRLPLFVRRLIASWARRKSKKHTSQTDLTIQDVNAEEVKRVMQQYNTQTLIHGHTHRPAFHEIELHNGIGQRIVLDAWHDKGQVLIAHPDGSFSSRDL